jgi:3-deoxy-manno-octulosonate cytidylyltransferase (CMP-KDO synthetase)
MAIKVVIPARLGSSRLPNKPILEISGKPMVLHVVDRCIEAGFHLDDIVVATDDERIIGALSTHKIRVVMTSLSHQSGTDRINEVAKRELWSENTIVVNVQGDEPLIPPRLIKSVADFAVANPEYDISTAVVPISDADEFLNPNVVKAIVGRKGRALYFTRSPSPFNRDEPQDLSLAKRHIGIYSYRVSALRDFCSHKEDELESYEKLEQLRALSNGMSVGVVVYQGNVPHGVDTQNDLDNIKLIMEAV